MTDAFLIFRALARKKPVERIKSSITSTFAPAIFLGVGNLRNSAGVTWLTRLSVHWALSTVATNNWNGVWKSNSHLTLG